MIQCWSDPDGRLAVLSQSYYYFDGRLAYGQYIRKILIENPSGASLCDWNGIANKPIVLSDGTWMLPTAVWRHGADLSMYEEAG